MDKNLQNVLIVGGLVGGIAFYINKKEPAWFNSQWKGLAKFDRKNSLAIFVPKFKTKAA